MYNYIKTKLYLSAFWATRTKLNVRYNFFPVRKAEIKRRTDMFQGYGVEQMQDRLHEWVNIHGKQKSRYVKARFIKVRNGHKVSYFPKLQKQTRFSAKEYQGFWNMYRITSIAGTDDYVTHCVK
jgi:hypothetical protein